MRCRGAWRGHFSTDVEVAVKCGTGGGMRQCGAQRRLIARGRWKARSREREDKQ